MASHMYIPDIHVHATYNAVTLVWGSLRLALINAGIMSWIVVFPGMLVLGRTT